MRCDYAKVMISALADGDETDLSTDRTAFQNHLATCADCRSFEATVTRLRRSLRMAVVDGDIDVTAAVLDVTASTRSHRGRRLTRPMAAVLVVVVGFGLTTAIAGWYNTRDVVVEADLSTRPVPTTKSTVTAANEFSTAVVWTRDRLDPAIVEQLEMFDEVSEMTVVRRGTAGLVASRSASGEPIDRLDEGWSIPIDIIAIEPQSYGAVIGDERLSGLADNKVVLSVSSAELRGVEAGEEATFDVNGAELTVVAVVEDWLVGAAEMAVTYSTGAEIGISSDRYALVTHAGSLEALGQTVRGATAEEVRVQNRDQNADLRSSDAVLPQIAIKLAFGEFAMRETGESFEVDPEWFSTNIVIEELRLVGSVTCHRLLMPQVRAALADIEEAGLGPTVDPDDFSGCWNPRTVRATGNLSHHSWGAAVDLTSSSTPENGPTPGVVDAFARYGLTWGGTWLVADPGHFEYISPPLEPTSP